MPLSQEEVDEVTNSFNILDVDKKGYLDKQQILSLFSDLKIHLTDEQSTVVADGMLACRTKATMQACINTISLLHDEDELGFLKICFRGIDTLATRSVDMQQALKLSGLVGKQKNESDFQKYVTDSDHPTFSFSNLADVILDLNIPEDADPFNGMADQSACCLII